MLGSPMDPARYRELAEAFASVCDLTADGQRAHLRALASRDPELAAELERMLLVDQGSAWLDRGPGAAARLLAPELEVPPARVGAFRLGAEIGRGGMGVVYAAEQEHPRRQVAVKILRGRASDSASAERFRAEAQALADLEHPGIPAVYAAGEEDGRLWLAMERVHGVPLDRAAPPELEGKLRLMLAVCAAVAHAHAHGVVHRDLKPNNVLVGADGQPRVLDFGIAGRALEESAAAGTPAYASPEQLAGAPPSPAADVYALACICWELCAGSRPPTPHPALQGDLGRALKAALRPDPQQRTPTVEVLAADLAAVLAHRPLRSDPGPWPHRARLLLRRRRRTAGALLAAGVLLGMVLAGAAWTEHQRERAAQAHLSVARARMGELRARGAEREAEGVFEAFVRLPEHRGTRALAEAWRERAEHQRAGGHHDEALRSLAEAWIHAPDRPSAEAAAVALGEVFDAERRYGALWELGRAQSSAVREALAQPLLRAAVARRDVAHARAVARPEDRGLDAVLALLGHATSLGMAPAGAALVDADGDGRPELWTQEGPKLQVWRLGEPQLVAELLSPPVPFANLDRLVRVGEHLMWVCMGADRSHVGVWEATPALDGWTLRAQLPASTPTAVASADLDGDGQPSLLVGLAYPVRRLLEVLPGGEVRSPHPDTDALESGIMALASGDLDGDGRTDLVVAPAAWRAYEVRSLLARDGGLQLGGRARLGAVHRLALLPRASGAPWVVAGKSDQTPSRLALGEHTPFGEPAGLYLLDPTAQMQPMVRIPSPIPDRGPDVTNTVEPLLALRLPSGPALAAGLYNFDEERWIWILPEPERAGGWLVAGLSLVGAADVDGDGLDEVLVQDAARGLWWLGIGEQTMPAWVGPEERASVADPPPRGADAAMISAWSRVQLLEQAGMMELAAAGFAEIAALAPERDTAARAHLAAGSIEEALGRSEVAADRYASALRDLPELLEVERQKARTGLARTAARTLRLEDAARAADGLDGLEWIARAASHDQQLELLSSAPRLDPRWALLAPAALAHDPRAGAWKLDVFNDGAEIARTRLRADGVRVGLEVEVEVELLELGSGVKLALKGPEGEPVLEVMIHGQGGGGFTLLAVNCGGGRVWTAELADGELTGPLRVRGERIDGLPGVVCAVTPEGGPTTWVLQPDPAPRPVPAGPLDLVVSTDIDRVYSPDTRWRAELRSLTTIGLSWPELRPGEPPRTSALALALAEGRADQLVARGDEPEAPELLARTGAPALQTVLAHLHAEGRRVELRQLLRRHEAAVAPALRQAVGREAFLDLFFEAWGAALRYRQRPDVASALGRPELDPLDGRVARDAQLLLARAALAWDLGRGDEVMAILQHVQPEDRTLRAEVALLRARVAAARGDGDAASRLADYLALAPPELGRDLAAIHPELEALLR
jgi:tetratricopeptide (TPR) repeat protein